MTAALDPNPIDAFILAKLQRKGTCSRRRARQIDAGPPRVSRSHRPAAHARGSGRVSSSDQSPDAFAKLVDRLLASPHYGERWGRHWLDVARYADSGGYEQDFTYPNAWRYRDYVIRAFNQDKPYDRFVREQIAGDELDDADYDALIATGFHRVGATRRLPRKGQSAVPLRSTWTT